MKSITEYLERLNKLTQQNLDILKALNDSFFTKKEHLVASVDDNKYVIPSFISLENKINALQEGFNNLVNAPLNGEAYFNYDGNSKSIVIRGFNNTPDALTLKVDNTDKFYVDVNSIFKDFITPNAHLKFDLTSLPDDICSVVVKKVTPITQDAKDLFASRVGEETAVQYAYKDLFKQLSILRKNVDYEEYDVIKQLPIRQSIGTGTYVITDIVKDTIKGDLSEQLVLQISPNTPLTYKKFDETIDIDLEVGQFLTTYNDRVKLQIVDINSRNNQLTLDVVNGDYLDLVPYTDSEFNWNNIQDLSKLRFFSDNDYSKDKYIDVTLEEDQYVGIFIAPLNSRMNVQGSWGNGVIVNSYKIKDATDEDVSYETYYKENVKNIGDVLKEITLLIADSSLTKYPKEEFDLFTGYKPIIDPDDLSVVKINKHLDESPTVQKIRSLYSQKKQYEIDLDDTQKKIADINTTLASTSFEDTNNIRTIYESQLNELSAKKNELVASINDTINEISLAVNNSEVPIENAKYHIRGFYKWDVDATVDEILSKYKEHIKGIQVQYRYKNKDQSTGNATSLKGGEFVFSDWNNMNGFDRFRVPDCNNDGLYKFNYPENNDDDNEPSFNQIDVAISQGETVDLRLRIVWDFGTPFVQTTSDWSDVLNIQFPEEYLKDVQILTIIEENNDDIETNRFKNILNDNGVTKHIDDKLTDQDNVYFHHPENISSGFYTAERRIIPLKDKLVSMDSAIKDIEDTINGTNSDKLKVEFVFDSTTSLIYPDQENTVNVNVENPHSSSDIGKNTYAHIANLQLTNISSRTVRLYSIFPGSRNCGINKANTGHAAAKYDDNKEYEESYLINSKSSASSAMVGVPGAVQGEVGIYKYSIQRRNQFIYFRSKDLYTDMELLGIKVLGDVVDPDDPASTPPSIEYPAITPLINIGLSQISLDSDGIRGYKTIDPGESLIIPIRFMFGANGTNPVELVIGDKLELSFDIKMSLYEDPTNYLISICNISAEDATLHQKVVQSQTNTTKYTTVITSY